MLQTIGQNDQGLKDFVFVSSNKNICPWNLHIQAFTEKFSLGSIGSSPGTFKKSY